ncbi:hypothetical protein BGZ57DRAFT_227798 [Hyaloscypha finlandica]|nr:hypothetical protein BGZ57DRAFT_227798 [Hyaloscypha finlandica]
MIDMHNNVLARNGDAGRDHIPAVPFWMAIVRAFQFLLALLVMALSAFASSVFGAAFFPGYGMSFFVFAWTLIFFGYILAAPLFFPEAYNYWAHLGLEIATNIFWLTTFALLAEEAAGWSIVGDFGLDTFLPKNWNAAIGATKAGAALGAINWALFIATLISFGIFLHQHRLAHGAAGFGGNRAPADAEKNNTVVTTHPVELNHVPQGHPQQQSHPAPTA